jgi:palmitoyltransferase
MATTAVPSGATSFPSSANGKASVAPPKVSNAELTARDQHEHKLPLHEDIMQLARLGDVGAIQKLINDGKFSAQHRDDEGISPLHVRP